MRIATATAAHAGDWIALRAALWPGDDHAAEIDRLLAAHDPEKLALLAFADAIERRRSTARVAHDLPSPLVLSSSKHRSSLSEVQTGEDHASPTDQPLGLAEASLRHDYVNGCDGSPVLFLEGLYVVPAARRRGVARALCDAVAAWGRALGTLEFASDALLDNTASHAMHVALGFIETERVVYFRRPLDAVA